MGDSVELKGAIVVCGDGARRGENVEAIGGAE
jgi:hypothetical protein